MSQQDSAWKFLSWIALGLIAAGGWSGCQQPAAESGESAGEPAATEQAVAPGEEEEADAPDLYTVRAEVVALPDAAEPDSGLKVHHEAIDDLKGVDGGVWGMDAMTMEFLVAEEVSLEDIAVGDKVEFTLAVAWFSDVPQQVTEIRKLPAETELEFRPAQPPGSGS